jgi:hypothetical protein
MTRATSVPQLGSEFNTFLFAPIGEERNGMLLSVLSALARLDVDPWHEAAELAGLPGKIATERLASLIATLPDGPSTPRDPRTIAARLIALLPRPARSDIPLRKTIPGAGALTDSRAAKIFTILLSVVFVAFVLTTQWVLVTHQSRAQADNAQPPAAKTDTTERPPRTSEF